jgi:Mce-associated membrane protein
MAEHADSAEQLADDGDVGGSGKQQAAAQDPPKEDAKRFSGVGAAVAAGLVVVVSVAGAAGWLGYRAQQERSAQHQHTLFLQAARQAAINLTTISYTEVDADIQRILDSATGAFRDDFQKRSGPFIQVVKQVQSKSEGTVSEAGFLTETRDQAQVLLAVSVKTSTAAGPEQDPRRWRLRIDVQKTNDGAKVSNVEFVP